MVDFLEGKVVAELHHVDETSSQRIALALLRFLLEKTEIFDKLIDLRIVKLLYELAIKVLVRLQILLYVALT